MLNELHFNNVSKESENSSKWVSELGSMMTMMIDVDDWIWFVEDQARAEREAAAAAAAAGWISIRLINWLNWLDWFDTDSMNE